MREDASVVEITAWATEITDLRLVFFLVLKKSKSVGKQPRAFKAVMSGSQKCVQSSIMTTQRPCPWVLSVQDCKVPSTHGPTAATGSRICQAVPRAPAHRFRSGTAPLLGPVITCAGVWCSEFPGVDKRLSCC